MDVRGAFIAWCTPSPFVLAVIATVTACWLIIDAAPGLAVFAGLGATALVGFCGGGPRKLVRSGRVCSTLLVGFSTWLTVDPRPHAHEGLCTLTLCALLASVMIIVLVRVQAVLEIATSLQVRIAAPTKAGCGRLPALLSAQLLHALSDGRPLDPELRRLLVQLAPECKAAEEAQQLNVRRSRPFTTLPVSSQQRHSQ